MPAIAVLDAGTGGAKCSVFDLAGRLLALRAERWDYTVVANPDLPVVKEYAFDPAQFWTILTRCTRAALADCGVAAADIVGVATTSQREGCVLLDADGRELYAGPNLDSRAFMEGIEVLGALGGERLYEITGHSAPFIFPLARYLWYRKRGGTPAARLLMINDWMTFRLSGVASTEPSNATESMLFDVRTRAWSEEILAQFEIPAAVLPPVFASGTRVGAVHAAAAAQTGLLEGTPVFTGGADTQCALLGAGALQVDDVAVVLGTTSPIQLVVDRPLFDPRANLWAGLHVVPERWVLESNLGSTGDAYLWLLDLLVPDGADRHARANLLAAAAQAGGTYSFIGPRVFDLTKMRPDMPGGVFFRFPSLQLRPTAGDLLRAFFESIAYALRANLAQIEAVTGRTVTTLIAGGGMSRNDLLMQWAADCVGVPIRRAVEPQSTGLGCAMLVAAGSGAYGDLAAAARAMCAHTEVHPDTGRRAALDSTYAKWCELYATMEGLSV
ncbi:MAG: FGGY-family carbohydrate kinase [Deltaproteobacteria bacterium]|nr:FGGY-family carbohydrate kinase [Deltaproteobacteria bacterium]